MSQASKVAIIKEMLESAESSLKSAKQLLNELLGVTGGVGKENYAKLAQENLTKNNSENKDNENDKIIEGVFNGETMIDKNGQEFPVPANYASKSKLVPGDILKLTIKENGTFLYKQIGPVERTRVIGILTYEDGQYKVIANGKAYKTLLASVTYYKGEVGDRVTLVVPEFEESDWGAIENILPKINENLLINDHLS